MERKVPKIKILHITQFLLFGGMERLIVNLAREIDREKFALFVCLLEPMRDTFFERELRRMGIPLFSLNCKNMPNPVVFFRLLKLFRQVKPHIIHTHLKALRYSFLPSLIARVPIHIHTVHALAKVDTKKPKDRFINRLIFRLGNVKIVSVSKEVAKTVKAVYGMDSVVIYNGVEEEFLANKEYEKKRSDVVKIFNVASFKKEKNISLLIDAFEKALAKEEKLRLILVGNGPLKDLIQNLIEEKRLKEKVILAGRRSDIPSCLSDCDIFALSSDSEGFGMAIIEAMAMGKPVIATNVGGIPEIVENGYTGLLVPPRNPQLLAEAILKLAKDEKLREEMGKRGRKKVENEFNMKLTAYKYSLLYEKVSKEKHLL
ncbi:MAG: glycosyltransferase [bacterium]